MVLPGVRRAWIPAGLVAGLAGAIAMDAFLLTAHWPGVAAPNPVEHYTFIASAVAGSAAIGASWAVPLGIVLHLIVAIGWSFGYLAAVEQQPQILRTWFPSGIVFGIVVWIVMVALLIPIGKYQPATSHAFDRDIIAHTLFFGLPLAFVASRLIRQA